MAFLVLWLRFFDLRVDSGAMIFVLTEWTEQFDYSSTAADINHVNAGHSPGSGSLSVASAAAASFSSLSLQV